MTTKALIAVAIALLAEGCWDDPRPAENQPARLNGFLMDGDPVQEVAIREGEQVTVSMVAWDPNGDELTPDNITWSCEDGSVEGSGSSVRIVAPTDIVWQTPPQEVTYTCTATITDGASDPDSASLTVEVLPPCPADNLAPEVNGVYAEPDHIQLGDKTTVWVDAVDPEGKTLTYEWTPPFGYIDGDGEQVEWVTDEVCCTAWYDVQVVVSDGCKSTWAVVQVHVDV